ncbi:MAG: AI-2E family transporter [Gemmataceae bacterium]|nr:AI-2E family transporter [Gemmataceae bacterium]MDW8265250.1 AI-2E family transporter [Gemmataceae bacterium]
MNLSDATRIGLNLLALLGAVLALRLGESVFVPTVLAVLLAALLWPAATWLNHRLRLPWSLACLLVVVGLVFLNLLVTTGFVMAVTRIVQRLPRPNDFQSQAEVYNIFRQRIEEISPVPLDNDYFPKEAENSRVFAYVRQTLEGSYITDLLLRITYYANNWLWHWVLVMFILLFLLVEGRMLSRRIVEIFGPSVEAQAKAVAALKDMANQVRTFLVWRTIVNFGLGLVVGIVYHALGLQQAWTWALLTAVLCYIPYLGPILAGLPPIIDAFMGSPSPWYAVIVVGFYVAIITLEGYVIVPVVMGRSMELNATTVMLACLFWDLVWGMPGLFLAMPLMAAIKAICHHVPGMRPWANLMGTSHPEPVAMPEIAPELRDNAVAVAAEKVL